ncbi:UPF0764 protein C16orf89 homolog [Eumeta japonica]|uniref:UPF0764 protein C16orf89 homolog n=1 Tax=Eumeta variegata TaxID=151549 RepID=A0A4C1UMV5_EUMVA|nr:UPF0764 protein C16orf89 homolog [Eumeta japonica]
MIHEIDGPLNYFRKRVSDKNSDYDENARKIVTLLNESSWTEKISEYTNGKLWVPPENFDLVQFDDWASYLKIVKEQAGEIPNPQQSDMCLASISENLINTGRQTTRCKIHNDCYGIVLNGTNYGFSFTHRLLFIVAAHFGRNCYIFSRSRDEVLIQEMCAWTLKEAQYIAEHGYKLRDLMMEQIALCTLNGYTEFIQPTWLSKFMELQSDAGCFGVLGRAHCHEHVTGVAAASLAAVIRFLIQDTYEEI